MTIDYDVFSYDLNHNETQISLNYVECCINKNTNTYKYLSGVSTLKKILLLTYPQPTQKYIFWQMPSTWVKKPSCNFLWLVSKLF